MFSRWTMAATFGLLFVGAALSADQPAGPPSLKLPPGFSAEAVRITPSDFDWSDRNSFVQQANLATRLFRRTDASGDGKLTKDELDTGYRRHSLQRHAGAIVCDRSSRQGGI